MIVRDEFHANISDDEKKGYEFSTKEELLELPLLKEIPSLSPIDNVTPFSEFMTRTVGNTIELFATYGVNSTFFPHRISIGSFEGSFDDLAKTGRWFRSCFGRLIYVMKDGTEYTDTCIHPAYGCSEDYPDEISFTTVKGGKKRQRITWKLKEFRDKYDHNYVNEESEPKFLGSTPSVIPLNEDPLINVTIEDKFYPLPDGVDATTIGVKVKPHVISMLHAPTNEFGEAIRNVVRDTIEALHDYPVIVRRTSSQGPNDRPVIDIIIGRGAGVPDQKSPEPQAQPLSSVTGLPAAPLAPKFELKGPVPHNPEVALVPSQETMYHHWTLVDLGVFNTSILVHIGEGQGLSEIGDDFLAASTKITDVERKLFKDLLPIAVKHLDNRARQKRETPGFTVQNKGGIFIHLHIPDGQSGTTSNFVSSLSHEAVHAAEAVMYYTGIHEDPTYPSECLAYVSGYIVRKIVVFANDLFTIRRKEAKRLKQLAASRTRKEFLQGTQDP